MALVHYFLVFVVKVVATGIVGIAFFGLFGIVRKSKFYVSACLDAFAYPKMQKS